MATILQKPGKKGLRYQVQVRRKGHPPATRTFERRTDAVKWGKRVETDIERGVFVSESLARKTLLSELVLSATNRAPQLDAAGDPLLDRKGQPVLGGNAGFLAHPERDQAKTIKKLAWWVKILGDPTLDRLLDGRLIREALSKLEAGAGPSGKPVSPATANRFRAAIRGALAYGVDRKYIPHNPARKEWAGKAGKEVERVRRLDVEERQRLLAACKRSADARLYPLVLLALASGGRQSELLGLKWSDIDAERGRVSFLDTKNGTNRGVGVSAEVLRVLRERVVRVVGCNLVFGEPGGYALNAENAKRPIARFPRSGWEAALAEAKVEGFRFHDTRHDFASRLAESGASLAELAEALGHKGFAMVRRYSHLCETHTATVTRRASEALLESAS